MIRSSTPPVQVAQNDDVFAVRLGDCMDPVNGLPAVADGAYDHIVSDPPYGARTHSGQRHGRRGVGYKDGWVSSKGLDYDHLTPDDVAALGAQFRRVARKWVLVMTSHDLVPHWESALGGYTFAPVPIVLPGMNVRLAGDGPSSWCVWLVVNRPIGLKDGTKPGAYVGSPGAGPERADNPVKGHKPLWLMEGILGDYSRPGDVICDPCLGSGTTLVAAKRMGRRGVGWERNPDNHAAAVQRLANTREQMTLIPEAAPRVKQDAFDFGLTG